jgi:hypothetical protein
LASMTQNVQYIAEDGRVEILGNGAKQLDFRLHSRISPRPRAHYSGKSHSRGTGKHSQPAVFPSQRQSRHPECLFDGYSSHLYFKPRDKPVILSEALRGSIANSGLYGAKSKDLGVGTHARVWPAGDGRTCRNREECRRMLGVTPGTNYGKETASAVIGVGQLHSRVRDAVGRTGQVPRQVIGVLQAVRCSRAITRCALELALQSPHLVVGIHETCTKVVCLTFGMHYTLSRPRGSQPDAARPTGKGSGIERSSRWLQRLGGALVGAGDVVPQVRPQPSVV